MKKVLLLLGLLTLPAGAQIIDPPDPSAPLPTWVSLRTAPPATAPLQRPIASAKEVPAWLREVQTLPPDWLQLGHWPAVSTPASRAVAELQRQDSRQARATLQALLEWGTTQRPSLQNNLKTSFTSNITVSPPRRYPCPGDKRTSCNNEKCSSTPGSARNTAKSRSAASLASAA